MTNSATQPRGEVPAAEKALLSALLWLGTGSTVHQVLLDPPACPLWWNNWIFGWQENSGCHWLQHGLQHCLPNILRTKLRSYGLDGCKTKWVNKWVDDRASRAAVTKLYSASWLASSWVPQEPLLGPVLLAHLAMKYTCRISSGHQITSSVHLRVGLPSRGTQAGWRNRPAWPTQSSTTASTNPSTAIAQAVDGLAGEELCWRGPPEPSQQQAECEPLSWPGHKCSQQLPGLGSQWHRQENESNSLSTFSPYPWLDYSSCCITQWLLPSREGGLWKGEEIPRLNWKHLMNQPS